METNYETNPVLLEEMVCAVPTPSLYSLGIDLQCGEEVLGKSKLWAPIRKNRPTEEDWQQTVSGGSSPVLAAQHSFFMLGMDLAAGSPHVH